MTPDGKPDIVDQLLARARRLDPAAWQHRDQLWAERGVNPDLLGERPRGAGEWRMLHRRAHSLQLATDEDLIGGDPVIATALRTLDAATEH
jgi:hypothetical protein